MKTFPYIDHLQFMKEKGLSRTTQLFVISLIAYYHECERSKGEIVGMNIEGKHAIYKLTLSNKEICQKFGFSVDLLRKIKRDLKWKQKGIIKHCKTDIERKEINPYDWRKWKKQYLSYVDSYTFKVTRESGKVINVPTRIIYDKNLTYSEKLSILWNLSLKEKLGHQPKLCEIEKESGISERTIRKAKNKYPKLFEKGKFLI